MTLAGTRPPTVDEWDKYELHHRARLATKPGLTGMWQVSGRSNITDFEEVVKLDKQYISEWTMGLDIGYIYRKNDMSVSWQYRPDSVENWFKLVYELKSWIEKKDKDPKEYTSLIGYLLIFAAFFDGKMEYMQHKKSLWAVRKVLKKYGSNPMGRKAFTELADRRKKLQITQKLWKIMIRTFSLGMKWRWYLLMSVGIKILVSCRVDFLLFSDRYCIFVP